MPKLTERLNVRLTTEQRRAIEAAAEVADCPPSEFARRGSVTVARAILDNANPEEIADQRRDELRATIAGMNRNGNGGEQ